MIERIDNITCKLLILIGFRKFMVGHALGLFMIAILSIRGAYRLLLSEKPGQAVGSVIVTISLYVGMRFFQRIWIDRGAEDRYLYFFLGESKKRG